MKPVAVIAVKNHGGPLATVLAGLATYDIPCIVVDDGCDAANRAQIDALAARHDWVSVTRFDENRGKGAALRHGYALAAKAGYSHAFQLDADGQHDPADLRQFLELAKSEPTALILGSPLFDESAPAHRLLWRQFSRGLVWLESLSFAIDDPLCGFRGVPLDSALALLSETSLGDRMDFEPEFAVRSLWADVPIRNLPVRVRYIRGGLSNFQPFMDSLRIARAHLRLLLGMLRRVPGRIGRNSRR